MLLETDKHMSLPPELNAWRKMGLIEFDRGVVDVPDPDALESQVWHESDFESSPPR